MAAGLGALGFGLGQRWMSQGGEPPPPAAAAASSSPDSPPRGFVEFRDEQAGFALAYPKDWARVQLDDPQVALLAVRSPQDYVQVRVLELDAPVGPQLLPDAKQLTGYIVQANQSVKLLAEPKRIELAGLPGYFYFYSFQDPASGQTGAHSHFFLFRGPTMISIVFQALPAERFPSLAPTFDQITGSFRLLPK
ncbi:MAG: PsbP-related protein [Pseudonocardiaceae bacterium]